MYRLRVIPVFLPSLRARRGDIPLLTEQMLQELNRRSERKLLRVSPGARQALQRYQWPGNVRELRNVLEYAFVVGDGPVLELSHLPPEVAAPECTVDGEPRLTSDPDAATTASLSPEAKRVTRALERASGNKARAAKALGMSRVTLWRRIKELGLTS
jgi:transcriptional regulator with PAS, ATPase and Fis domain